MTALRRWQYATCDVVRWSKLQAAVSPADYLPSMKLEGNEAKVLRSDFEGQAVPV